MKKRWISLLLVSAMTLSMLAGCGSSEDTAEDTSEGGEGDKITLMVPDWAYRQMSSWLLLQRRPG